MHENRAHLIDMNFQVEKSNIFVCVIGFVPIFASFYLRQVQLNHETKAPRTAASEGNLVTFRTKSETFFL